MPPLFLHDGQPREPEDGRAVLGLQSVSEVQGDAPGDGRGDRAGADPLRPLRRGAQQDGDQTLRQPGGQLRRVQTVFQEVEMEHLARPVGCPRRAERLGALLIALAGCLGVAQTIDAGCRPEGGGEVESEILQGPVGARLSGGVDSGAPSSDVESYHINTDAEEDVWLLTEGSDWVGSDDAAMGDL